MSRNLCNTSFQTMFIIKVNCPIYMWRIYNIPMYKMLGHPQSLVYDYEMENSITWVKDYYKSKSYITRLSGLFGPTQVGFCTCIGRPTREGPFFIRIFGVHHIFGHLWCGCFGGVGSSTKLGVSSTNLGSCVICSCKMLCLGFTPFNATSMF